MTLDLLNRFSTATLILLVVGGTTLVAVVAALLVRKRFPNLAETDFENLTGILRGDVFALLYTIVLALVIADQSGSMATASSTVSAESSALAEMSFAYESFPAPQRVPISNAMDEYLHAVVQEEWPDMQRGGVSLRAAAALEGLVAAYRNYEPQTEVQKTFYAKSIDNIGNVVRERRERLQQSQEGLSPLLRTLLVVGAIVFIFLAYPASVRSLPIQLLIVAATAAFVSFAYLLTMVLDYPYAGDVAVDNTPYKSGVLAQFWGSDEPPRPLDSDAFGKLKLDDLVGNWNSDNAFGELLFRKEGDQIRAAFRLERGTVTGTVSEDGVFRGWWCDEPGRLPPDDAGQVEWRLLTEPGSSEEKLDGRWRYGDSEPFRGGWDLTKIGGLEPADLDAMFDDPSVFCSPPG